MTIDMDEIPTGTHALLPLSRRDALQRAVELKRHGLPWSAVARVMGDYHGQWLAPDSWRMLAISAGLDVPKRALTPGKRAALERMMQHNRAAFEERRTGRKQIVDGVAA